MYTQNGEEERFVRGRQKGTQERSGRDGTLRFCGLIFTMVVLVLAGCGDLSLVNVLENEAPGEFQMSPSTAILQVNQELVLTAIGGFTPYKYALQGESPGSLENRQNWVYRAPATVSATDYELVSILATDALGSTDTATVKIIHPFELSGEPEVTLTVGEPSYLFGVSGGVPPYDWFVDDEPVLSDSPSYSFQHLIAGTFVVSVEDSLGTYKAATVTVVPASTPGVPLSIDPAAAGTEVGGTVIFTAFGGTGNYAWSATGGSIPPAGSSVTYSAPSAEGTVTVTLSDGLNPPVTVKVIVTRTPIPRLVLSPQSPAVRRVGEQVQFQATGGVPPYTFSTNDSRSGAFLDPVNTPGLYTQLRGGKNVTVTLRDSSGRRDTTRVRWKKS
jgi:hypothetical protein